MTNELTCIRVPERRAIIRGYRLNGWSLKYVSGPDATNGIKRGAWLNTWALENTMREFGFGSFPEKSLVFATKEEALGAKAELEQMAGVITEIAE
jgi:hypothetical protein